ncbi:alpha/beta-hydrolase [Auricularia subglabra TFB-10046 SS5]|nr:alpha/beta-hydrolase [Auricularia subglabra TFB-10046 SS5]
MPTTAQFQPGAHSFTTATGSTLTYYVTGSGPRVLVNVAPGWGCASELYQNSFQFFDAHFTIAHFESRGTRGSSFPADLSQMSSWHMADDVEALRVHLQLDALNVMGHSNGGAIALWYAIRFPERVAKIVLLGAQLLGATEISATATQAILDAHPDREAVAAFGEWGQKVATGGFASDDEFAAGLRAFFPLYVARPEKNLSAVLAAFTNTPQAACILAQRPAEVRHGDQTGELGTISVQTLVVVGREDFICPVPVSEKIAAGIKASDLHVIDNAGHFPWIEEKEEFVRDVFDFFGCA